MKERQIIYKLKTLKKIKPEEEWKNLTRARIMGPVEPRETLFSRGFLPLFGIRLRPIPLMVSGTIIALVVFGIFAYFNLGASINPRIANNAFIEHGVARNSIQDQGKTDNYLFLAEKKLSRINEPKAEDIKETSQIVKEAVKDMASVSLNTPEETAKVVKSVANINRKVKELENAANTKEEKANIEQLKEQTTVLTTKTTEVLKENIQSTTAQLVENLLRILGTKSLTSQQKQLFDQAKIDYNNQNYERALEKILILTDNGKN